MDQMTGTYGTGIIQIADLKINITFKAHSLATNPVYFFNSIFKQCIFNSLLPGHFKSVHFNGTQAADVQLNFFNNCCLLPGCLLYGNIYNAQYHRQLMHYRIYFYLSGGSDASNAPPARWSV